MFFKNLIKNNKKGKSIMKETGKKEPELDEALKSYLRMSQIPLSFIDFKRSLISERYDGRDYAKDFQILLLQTPEDVVFELETTEWQYEAETVLLVFSKISKTVTLIPLKFQLELSGMDQVTEFSFCHYQSLLIREGHLLIAAYGQSLKDDRQCLNLALFAIGGPLISVWQAESVNSYKCRIDDFRQLEQNHWIAKIELNRGKNEQMVHGLHLLSLDQIKTDNLLGEEFISEAGTLLGSRTNEISSWFNKKSIGTVHFFILASFYQWCIFRFHNSGIYQKIVDTKMGNSFMGSVDWVDFEKDKITVHFKNNRTLARSGSFSFLIDELFLK